MNPKVTDIETGDDEYTLKFRLSGVNVSLANALRRTIMTDIPTVCIKTEFYYDNQCQIEVNTTQFFNNEILKQRLSCIPIHITDDEEISDFIQHHQLVVDVKNDTDANMYLTTEHFQLRDKRTGEFIAHEKVHKFFPPCHLTQHYIDFVLLRPGLDRVSGGDHVKLVADFSVGTARENSMFNVVSKSFYQNTVDEKAAKEAWEVRVLKLRTENPDMTEAEIDFLRRDFNSLDKLRYYIPDSYDFTVKSIGVFQCGFIVEKACQVLINKLHERATELTNGIIIIKPSETTIEYSFDIRLENEDYTIGKVLEYLIYKNYYESSTEKEAMTFCGFNKPHPHETYSIIRVAYSKEAEITEDKIKEQLRRVIEQGVEIFTIISKNFSSSK